DWATAAEQSSEEDEAQEGSVLAEEERAAEPAERAAIHIEGEILSDDTDDTEIYDPEADAIVNDALNLDEAAESQAAAEVLNDAVAEELAENAAAEEVTAYDGPELGVEEDAEASDAASEED